jgi:hypothetical protein
MICGGLSRMPGHRILRIDHQCSSLKSDCVTWVPSLSRGNRNAARQFVLLSSHEGWSGYLSRRRVGPATMRRLHLQGCRPGRRPPFLTLCRMPPCAVFLAWRPRRGIPASLTNAPQRSVKYRPLASHSSTAATSIAIQATSMSDLVSVCLHWSDLRQCFRPAHKYSHQSCARSCSLPSTCVVTPVFIYGKTCPTVTIVARFLELLFRPARAVLLS